MTTSRRNAGFHLASPFRRLTATFRSPADVVICGAQKSGTTYLAELLAAQPGFHVPPIKEIHFFNGHWAKGTAWYASHFQLRSSGNVQVDASPSYMIHGSVPERIRATNPDARVIFILRDPVARAYSHYQHNLRAGWEKLDFASALDAEDERIAADLAAMERDPDEIGFAFGLYSYRSRGLYARYLERFYRVFPRDQVLVLDSECVFRHDPKEIGLLEDFVGRPVAVAGDENLNTNSGSYRSEPSTAEEELRDFFDAQDAEIVAATGRRFSWMGP